MFDLISNFHDPFRTIEALERDNFNCFMDGKSTIPFRMDVIDDGPAFTVEADLPGFDKKDIHLEIQNERLMIQAERKPASDDAEKDSKLIHQERATGVFSRCLDVSGVDTERICSSYENGVLKLTLPKLDNTAAPVRKINIA